MAKFLVTGGAGFIGSHVVGRLVKNEENVLVADNFSTGKMENLADYEKHAAVVNCDITSFAELRGVFMAYRPDVVIHLAAQAAITTAEINPLLDLNVNGLGTLGVLLCAKEFEVGRVVYASTSAVYGHKLLAMKEYVTKLCPETYYGVSKLTGEKYTEMMDVQTTTLRFGNVYGPRQVPIGENQVIARMLQHLVHQEDFYIFGDGNQKRDFVYVEDVAEAVVSAAYDQGLAMHQVYNIAGGKSYSVNEVAKTLGSLWGYQDKWKYQRSRIDARTNVRMDIENAFAGLGWKPETDLREGLKRTIEWWRTA